MRDERVEGILVKYKGKFREEYIVLRDGYDAHNQIMMAAIGNLASKFYNARLLNPNYINKKIEFKKIILLGENDEFLANTIRRFSLDQAAGIKRIITCNKDNALDFYNFYKTNFPKEGGQVFCDEYSQYNIQQIEDNIARDIFPDGIQHINKTLLCRLFNDRSDQSVIKDLSNWNKEDFVDWYREQLSESKCSYCHCTREELMLFSHIRVTKRDRGGSWEIDRINPNGNYERNNCKIACYYCNNAKSDIFLSEGFGEDINGGNLIGNAIGKAIKGVIEKTL